MFLKLAPLELRYSDYTRSTHIYGLISPDKSGRSHHDTLRRVLRRLPPSIAVNINMIAIRLHPPVARCVSDD